MSKAVLILAVVCCFLLVSGSIGGILYWKRCDLELVDCPSPEPEKVKGCTDSAATNYSPSANEDDGSCEYSADFKFVVPDGPSKILCSELSSAYDPNNTEDLKYHRFHYSDNEDNLCTSDTYPKFKFNTDKDGNITTLNNVELKGKLSHIVKYDGTNEVKALAPEYEGCVNYYIKEDDSRDDDAFSLTPNDMGCRKFNLEKKDNYYYIKDVGADKFVRFNNGTSFKNDLPDTFPKVALQKI